MSDFLRVGAVVVPAHKVHFVVVDDVKRPEAVYVAAEGASRWLIATKFTSVGRTHDFLTALKPKLPGFVVVGMLLCRREHIVALEVEGGTPVVLKAHFLDTLAAKVREMSVATYASASEGLAALELIHMQLADNKELAKEQ